MMGMQMVPWHRSAVPKIGQLGNYVWQPSVEPKGSQARHQFERKDLKVIEKKEGDQGSDITSRSEVVVSRLSAMNVVIPNLKKVKSYLLNYPDMIDILEPVCAAVLERFPPPSQVALELYQDPEIDDQYLTVYVRQHEYGEDVLDGLHGISRQFDELLCDTSGWLLITTDFQDPL